MAMVSAFRLWAITTESLRSQPRMREAIRKTTRPANGSTKVGSLADREGKRGRNYL
jgi:hypothetical protein